MKTQTSLIFIMVIFSMASSFAQNQVKRYQVKSGKVEYKTTISGHVMGSNVEGSGSETLYFRDWGMLELKDAQSTKTTTVKLLGQESSEVETTRSVVKMTEDKIYTVDFNEELIYVVNNMKAEVYAMTNADEAGDDILESLGGKKIGTEKVLAYTCDVWDVAGGKQWFYKGVILKSEVSLMGITTLIEATSAQFGISVDLSYFQLPDFPVQQQESFMEEDVFGDDEDGYSDDEEEMTKAEMEKLSKMTFEEWKKAVQEGDADMQEYSEAQLRGIYDMTQKFIKIKLQN